MKRIEFKVGKYYTLDYDKIFDTYDLKTWPNFAIALRIFKDGRKALCTMAHNRCYSNAEKNDFVASLTFENGTSWGYTAELASLFKEWKNTVQEELDV